MTFQPSIIPYSSFLVNSFVPVDVPMGNDQTPIYSSLSSEEDLREIIVMFTDEMPGRIERFEKAFAAKDWEELEVAAHQLKGSAGGHGFMPVSIAAAELDEKIKVKAPEPEIKTAMNTLIALCRRTGMKS